MDAWASVGRDIDRVVGKFHSSQLHTSRVCDDLNAELSRLEAELNSNPGENSLLGGTQESNL